MYFIAPMVDRWSFDDFCFFIEYYFFIPPDFRSSHREEEEHFHNSAEHKNRIVKDRRLLTASCLFVESTMESQSLLPRKTATPTASLHYSFLSNDEEDQILKPSNYFTNNLPLEHRRSSISQQRETLIKESSSNNDRSSTKFLYYLIYALVNVIISAPGLYGYAAVVSGRYLMG